MHGTGNYNLIWRILLHAVRLLPTSSFLLLPQALILSCLLPAKEACRQKPDTVHEVGWHTRVQVGSRVLCTPSNIHKSQNVAEHNA